MSVPSNFTMYIKPTGICVHMYQDMYKSDQKTLLIIVYYWNQPNIQQYNGKYSYNENIYTAILYSKENELQLYIKPWINLMNNVDQMKADKRIYIVWFYICQIQKQANSFTMFIFGKERDVSAWKGKYRKLLRGW